jgi:hypothetical protein
MPLNKAKRVIEEVAGIRCAVAETGVNQSRATFLKDLLTHNGYEVQVEALADGLFKVGVTDILFHPVVDVYKRKLRSLSGKHVTPAYWLQTSTAETEREVNYWNFTATDIK